MFPQNLTTFDEIGDPNDILRAENLLDYDYQELQAKYNILCKTYAEEIETSNKIKKSLGKCLKFYSKLCKKYEAQQITIDSLQKNMKQKIHCLEESLKNQEKMKGLIDVYKRERILYCTETNFNLKKDKEILLDVCCKLISESVKTNSIRNLTNLILKKFKNDLDKEKINLLKEKQMLTKPKSEKLKTSAFILDEPNSKPDLLENNFEANDIRNSENTKLEGNTNFELNKSEKIDFEDNKALKVENKKTCEIFTESNSQKIDNLEKINGCYSKEYKLLDEDEKEKNKCKIKEKVPDILALSKNLLPAPEKLDKEFVELNSHCNSIESGNNVIKNVNSDRDTEKRNECNLFTNVMNTGVGTGVLNIFCSQENESMNVEVSNINSFEVKQKNKDICKVEELLLESSNTKENLFVNGIVEVGSEIVPEVLCKNTQENSSLKPNHIEFKENHNKKILNSELNNVNSINNSLNSLFDVQENNKIKPSFYSNNQEVPPIEIITCEKPVLQKSTSPDNNFLEITENEQVSNEIHIQNGSINLQCQNDEVDKFSLMEQNMNNSSNSDSDSETLSEDLDFKKLETIHTELSQIFNEMSTLRLLSPIREVNESHHIPAANKEKNYGEKLHEKFFESKLQSCSQNLTTKQKKRKSPVCDFSERKKIKLSKKKNCVKQKNEISNGLLDTIMEAMSTQNAQFKSNTIGKIEATVAEQPSTPVENIDKNISRSPHKQNLEFSRTVNLSVKSNKEVKLQKIQSNAKVNQLSGEKRNENKLNFENLITQKIQQFISSSISSNEEAEKNITDCLAALENVSATAIAKSAVGLVLANIDEKVEIFERPVPPLTRTQCRLVTLLSVLKTKNSKFEKIIDIIIEEISTKLFPDNFFWPDDSVEMASRFYTALCKNRNDSENLWKFCLQAMMDMKQRSSVVIFTVLKTWPDILHEESTLKNNILATTIVNIILHMTLNNTLANNNQKKKLLALKHLLMNFYGFKVNVSIEDFANTLLESFFKNESVAEKSLVLLIRCRDVVWTSKYVFPKLGKVLKEWGQNPVEGDVLGVRVLGVLKQTVSVFSENKGNFQKEAQILISFLSDVLTLGKLSHESEQKVVEILLCLQQYSDVKKTIREWVPKGVVKECLKNKIFKLTSENILQELKFNRRRDLLENQNKSKGKKKTCGGVKSKKKGKKKKFKNKQCKGKFKKKNCNSQLNSQGFN